MPLGWKLDVFAIAVLASDGDHVLATRFCHGEYAISHGSESISLHNDDDDDDDDDDVDDVRWGGAVAYW